MYVVVGSIRVKPEGRTRFLEAASDNATSSVRDEPGCLRFEVFEDCEHRDHFVFVEVYADESSFQAHLETDHYARWSATRPTVLSEEPSRTICELRLAG